jgi:integrase/recombinase XerD
MHNKNTAIIEDFCNLVWLADGLSKRTVAAYGADLHTFNRWLIAQDICLLQTTEANIVAWMNSLLANGTSPRSVARYVSSLKRFYQHLGQDNLIEVDPVRNIGCPRYHQKLPEIPSEEDVANLLDVPELNSHIGLRDKAILEMLYATGVRSSELAGMRVSDIDFDSKSARIMGKGDKERIVLFGDEAKFWLMVYLDRSRRALAKVSLNQVFVTAQGKPMTPHCIGGILKRNCLRRKMKKRITPHGLRHAFATHLLNAGANLIMIRDLLGHASVVSTQIYTQVATKRLKQLHTKHHPRSAGFSPKSKPKIF